jgi:hypothetical protein
VDVLAPLIVIVVLTAVVLLVSAPLRGGASARAEERTEVRRADLEAARESKYHEIRDAELDYRTGKMSPNDWRRLDRELRAEAIEILRQLDQLPPAPTEDARPAKGPAPQPAPPPPAPPDGGPRREGAPGPGEGAPRGEGRRTQGAQARASQVAARRLERRTRPGGRGTRRRCGDGGRSSRSAGSGPSEDSFLAVGWSIQVETVGTGSGAGAALATATIAA